MKVAEVSIVIPAYNEAEAVGDTVAAVRKTFDGSGHKFEIIVVDDGSTDGTAGEAEKAGAIVIRHPRNIGYGNAIITGVRHANYPLIGLTDADGTYPVEELPSMATELEERGLDMLVGARKGRFYQGGLIKSIARLVFRLLSEFTVGRHIPDINSGLRIIRRDMINRFSPVLCGGFSFTTTVTIIAMLTYHFVDYRNVSYGSRIGKSKVVYFRDILGAMQIIVMTILIFNPIKLYICYSALVLLTGAPIILLCIFIPKFISHILIASIFIAVAFILMGMSFMAEQRRSCPQDMDAFRRKDAPVSH